KGKPARRATAQERPFSTAWYSSTRCHPRCSNTTSVPDRTAADATPRPRAGADSQYPTEPVPSLASISANRSAPSTWPPESETAQAAPSPCDQVDDQRCTAAAASFLVSSRAPA